jgi:intracellular sulfur oxidation DsrE/DsrF family protein
MQKSVVSKMKGATLVLMIGLVSMLPACTTQSAVAETGKTEADTVKRVVWHVDYKDPMRLGRMLTSVNNMVITYEGELADYDIRIVFLGAGIRFVTSDPLKKTPFAEDKMMRKEREVLTERLQTAMNQGIKLELCKITADAINLDESTVLKGVKFVPSGVVRIVELQQKGYGYLKAD